MKAFITGGAGFIGSTLADKLLKKGFSVTVYDNLSTGQPLFYEHNLSNPNYTFIEADISDKGKLNTVTQGVDMIFHFQANADVRGGMRNTGVDLEQNIIGTHNALEAARINNIKKFAFASSAAIYGEPAIFPTPENIAVIQTSLYGASKFSAEALIQAYSEYYDIQSWIYRFVSFTGPRYTHGVIFDFMRKLINNPNELEILGNGQQRKSYLDVADGVEAIFQSVMKAKDKINIFNLGNEEFLNVKELASEMLGLLNLKNTSFKFTGGERGWKGDSPLVQLDIKKIQSIGWTPTYTIRESIKRTVEFLSKNSYLLEVID
ncbi:MAG: GDP-mannose 4,6-dehydratase [Ekhidna sp.]|nr:GDP-mannose 4,6-dehydratase [Ekhidna sp.]MBC6409631.1 GDP-mannose 4,6-dehydratase [Ekhidna sp.]